MSDKDTQSPFSRPDLSEGYPLEKEERDSLRRAIRELEGPVPSPPERGDGNGGPAVPSES
jgi:hypothetical protein